MTLPIIIWRVGVYDRQGNLRREINVLPDGTFPEPFDLAPDEVVWTIFKQGERMWWGVPYSTDPTRAPWARDDPDA